MSARDDADLLNLLSVWTWGDPKNAEKQARMALRNIRAAGYTIANPGDRVVRAGEVEREARWKQVNIVICAATEYLLADQLADESEVMGRHAAVRGMMVRLGLYDAFNVALESDFNEAAIRRALPMQPPAGETIRATQDGRMEAAPVTGQSPVGAASTECEHDYVEVSSATDFEGETYRCSKCGDRYRLYYEDMK